MLSEMGKTIGKKGKGRDVYLVYLLLLLPMGFLEYLAALSGFEVAFPDRHQLCGHSEPFVTFMAKEPETHKEWDFVVG